MVSSLFDCTGDASGKASQSSCGDCDGWECYCSQNTLASTGSRKGAIDFCDIPILNDGDISEDIWSDPSWAEKPFLLRYDSSNSYLLEKQRQFGKVNLLKVAKERNLSTRVGRSWDIVMNSGEGGRRVPLEEYLETSMRAKLHDGDTPLELEYSFDRHSELLEIPGIDFEVHPMIMSWNASAFRPGAAVPIVLIGGSGSGVGFHRHAAAFQAIFHGWKRWLFYGPDQSPPGGIHGGWPIFDWLREVYPSLKGESMPRECIQKPGDLMYIPEAWYHATINLADSVAVSMQRKDHVKKSLNIEFDARRASNIRSHTKRLKRLLKLEPNNLEAKVLLYRSLRDSDLKNALKIIQTAIIADPYLVDAQYELIDFVAARIKRGETDAKQYVAEALAAWKPYLEHNRRSLKANFLLAQHYLFLGDQDRGKGYLRRNAELQKLGITAVHVPDFASVLQSTFSNGGGEL